MPPSALREPNALLEREHEVEQVDALLRAAAGGAGGALVIEGAAGMGKSRLLGEVRSLASGLGLRVLYARATELERGFPFGVMRQLFERALLEAGAGERDRWLAGAASLATEVLTGAPAAASRAEPAADSGYAWQHGLYWLASNASVDAPLVLLVDDLQWCDAPSARALAFMARRLEGQPLALVLATRPLDPLESPEAAALVDDPATRLVRPAPLSQAGVRAQVVARLSGEPDHRFVGACLDATGGNPFLVGELLGEAAACGLPPTAAAADELGDIVPRGVAGTVLLRLARLDPAAAEVARAISILGDGAQVGDAARLTGLAGAELEAAIAALASAGIVEAGGMLRFVHPLLRTTVYRDQSPAERQRLHRAAVEILAERGAPPLQVAAQVMQTEPQGDQSAVALLYRAAHEAWALGDAAGTAALLLRALEEPPAVEERLGLLLDLGQAQARIGSPEAITSLSEVVEHGERPAMIAKAASELCGMLFYAGRASEGAAIAARARARLPADGHPREQLEATVLAMSYTSASARREAEGTIAALRDPGGPARDRPQATTLATLALDEAMYLGSAAKAADLAERALAADIPVEAQRGGNWAVVALGALTTADGLEAALRRSDELIARARERGAALTVATLSGLRATIAVRSGDLTAAQADAQAAIALAPDLLGAEFALVLALPAAVLAGLERKASPDSLRRLVDRSGVRYDDTDLLPSSQLRYASGVLRAAAGNHEGAIQELRGCAHDDPAFGGENPAVLPWRSAAALSLAELGRHEEARALAADELRRAEVFGARRAIGIALRAHALVGPQAARRERLAAAVAALADSPARLEHARVLVDLGAALRAAGQRRAAREPLLEGLALASGCGARALERRARSELAAIGVRPHTSGRTGAGSLTPSERRIVELAAAGSTNREIAQTLFVTEKTVETHLGRAFRKLDVSSRRQLPEVLASTAG